MLEHLNYEKTYSARRGLKNLGSSSGGIVLFNERLFMFREFHVELSTCNFISLEGLD